MLKPRYKLICGIALHGAKAEL
jgi:hypothetical protein